MNLYRYGINFLSINGPARSTGHENLSDVEIRARGLSVDKLGKQNTRRSPLACPYTQWPLPDRIRRLIENSSQLIHGCSSITTGRGIPGERGAIRAQLLVQISMEGLVSGVPADPHRLF
jgi:hypothetical protein